VRLPDEGNYVVEKPGQPFGYTLYSKTTMTAWYEDEEFWRDNYEAMFSEDAFRRAAEDIDHVVALSGTHPHHVLDLCCGPGRHTIPLAQKGLEVLNLHTSFGYFEDRHDDGCSQTSSRASVLAEQP